MVHCCRLWVSLCITTLALLGAAEEQQKRAPSGFTGVRGKKSIPDSAYSESKETTEISTTDDVKFVDKRAPSGFLGMRGKKPYDGWISQEYVDDIYKRVPSGFMGMRGKKELFLDEDYDKRAPSGFFGMRGKKPYDDDSDFMDKRAPSGFFGMRGKKEYDSIINADNAETKRASENRFFGMRGKKQPNRMGFFGMRGKKFPYDVRGKFVGVRGKKSQNDLYETDLITNDVYSQQLPRYGNELKIEQLMNLLAESRRNEIVQNEKSDGYFARQIE